MSNVLYVVDRIFNSIFGTLANVTSPINLLIYLITRMPYLFFGVVFLIIGFSVGLIKRMIHN